MAWQNLILKEEGLLPLTLVAEVKQGLLGWVEVVRVLGSYYRQEEDDEHTARKRDEVALILRAT